MLARPGSVQAGAEIRHLRLNAMWTKGYTGGLFEEVCKNLQNSASGKCKIVEASRFRVFNRFHVSYGRSIRSILLDLFQISKHIYSIL